MPFTLRTEGFRDNPRRFAFMHGPLVLAAQVAPGKPFPVIVAEEKQLLASLQPVDGKPSTFTGPASIFRVPGDNKGVTLEPLYKIHGDRHYVVYFDWFTPAQWQAKEAEYRAEAGAAKGLGGPHDRCCQPGRGAERARPRSQEPAERPRPIQRAEMARRRRWLVLLGLEGPGRQAVGAARDLLGQRRRAGLRHPDRRQEDRYAGASGRASGAVLRRDLPHSRRNDARARRRSLFAFRPSPAARPAAYSNAG